MRRWTGGLGVALCVAGSASSLSAQQPPQPPSQPPVRVDTAVVRGDTSGSRATPPQSLPPRRPRAVAARPLVRPPLSPRRALLYSLAMPGLGQVRLDRATTGAFFVAVEAAAFAMVAKSAFDLREAKTFRGDSLLVTSYPVDSLGAPVTPTTGDARNSFSSALVRARRVHLEDWLAVIAFNHLIAGAEAFVSANLWSVPAEVSVEPSRRGPVVAVRARW